MNILMLSAYTQGMTQPESIAANQMLIAQARLLGLDAAPTRGKYNGEQEQSLLVRFKTDHEKNLCYRLARAHQQHAVYVVENVTVRGGKLSGTGGLELRVPGEVAYYGMHDDITITCSVDEPVDDYTLLPPEMGGVYIQCK
jgi:hypothetical protein